MSERPLKAEMNVYADPASFTSTDPGAGVEWPGLVFCKCAMQHALMQGRAALAQKPVGLMTADTGTAAHLSPGGNLPGPTSLLDMLLGFSDSGFR